MRCTIYAFVMLIASPALAFEGDIDARSIGDTGSVTLQIRVSKKGDVRMDTSMTGPDSKPHRASYIKPAAGKYNYALDHAQKQAMKIPKENLAKATNGRQGAKQGKKAKVAVKELGRETIAGQTTRHLRIVDKDEGDTAELWLSDQYPATLWHSIFSAGNDQTNNASRGWSRAMEREYGIKPGFVMKMLSQGKDGKKSGLEVTRMQKKKVSPDAFALPPGYEVVEMPVMPSGIPSVKAPTTQEEAEKLRDEWMEKMKEMEKQQR